MKVQISAALLLLCLAANEAVAWPASTPAPAPSAEPAPAPAPPASTPTPPAPAASKPGTAAADNLVIAVGATKTIRIPHLEIAGSTLTGSDIVALFALKDAKAIEARLRGLDATAIDMPEIVGDGLDGTTTTHWVAHDVHLADIKAGRAATARIATSTLSIKDDKSATTFASDSLALRGLALAQFAHLATGPRTGDEALAPLLDDLEIAKVAVGDSGKPTATATIAALRATGVKARPLPQRAAKPTEAAEDTAVFLDVLHAFAADDLEADGLFVAPDGTAGNVLKMSLDHVALKGLADARLARFELSGLAVDGDEKKPGHVAIAGASLEGVVVGDHAAAGLDHAEVHGVTADVPNEDWGKSARMKLAIARAAYDSPGLVIGKLPTKAVLTIDHVTTEVPPEAQGAAVLYAMGYKTIDLSCRIASRYDPAGQTLVIEPFALTGAGMGTASVKLDLSHVSEAIVSQNDALQKAAASAIRIKGLDVTLDNAGLVEKVSGFAAAGNGQSPQEVRTNAAAQIDLGLAGLGLQDSAKARTIADALRAFLADPKSVHVALASRDGLDFDAAQKIDNPQTLLDALDVEAQANR